MKQELVKDWMTRDAITITPKTPLLAAHRLISEHSIRRLPMMKGDLPMGAATRGDIYGAEACDATTLSI
jgi:acetoin utilization protein AcuB